MTTPVPHDTSVPFSRLRLLVGAYVGLCVITVVGEAAASFAGWAIDGSAWSRTGILMVVSLVTALILRAAANGSARAFLRLRVLTAVQVVAIAVIVALPGAFAGWLRIEQAVCGLVLIGVVVVANGRALRSAFAARTVAG